MIAFICDIEDAACHGTWLGGRPESFQANYKRGKHAAEVLNCTLEVTHGACSSMHTSNDREVFFSNGEERGAFPGFEVDLHILAVMHLCFKCLLLPNSCELKVQKLTFSEW